MQPASISFPKNNVILFDDKFERTTNIVYIVLVDIIASSSIAFIEISLCFSLIRSKTASVSEVI